MNSAANCLLCSFKSLSLNTATDYMLDVIANFNTYAIIIMNDFKTKFNPLVAVFRLVLSLIFGGLCIFISHHLLRDLGSVDFKLFLISIALLTILGVLFIMFFKPF